MASADDIGELIGAVDGLGAVFHTILDRREKSGRMPKTLSVVAGPELGTALRQIFGAEAVRLRSTGVLQLRFSKAELGPEALAALLYRAVRRKPSNPIGELRELHRALERRLLELEPRSAVGRAYVSDERAILRGEGRVLAGDAPPLRDLAERDGLETAVREAERVVRVLDALAVHAGLARLPAFATATLGHSKALRWNGDTFRRAGRALATHDDALRWEMIEEGTPPKRMPARAFELSGVYRDTAAASVLLYGPLVYRKGGVTFRGALEHARLGEPVRLTTAQLRDVEVEPVERVFLVENLTPFLDLVDAARQPRPDEVMNGLVVCTGGQASWAVVGLLRALAAQQVPMQHAGDLDRSGVLILRSLRRRTGARIEPWFMDAETHRRFADRGLPLSGAETARVGKALGREDGRGLATDVLQEVARTGLWIEQEAFSDETLVPSLREWLRG